MSHNNLKFYLSLSTLYVYHKLYVYSSTYPSLFHSPTKLEKLKLCAESGITNVQLRNWFTNIRKRHFRPTLQKGRAPRSALDLAIQQQRGKVTLMETHNRKKGSNSNSNSKASMTPSI